MTDFTWDFLKIKRRYLFETQRFGMVRKTWRKLDLEARELGLFGKALLGSLQIQNFVAIVGRWHHIERPETSHFLEEVFSLHNEFLLVLVDIVLLAKGFEAVLLMLDLFETDSAQMLIKMRES